MVEEIVDSAVWIRSNNCQTNMSSINSLLLVHKRCIQWVVANEFSFFKLFHDICFLSIDTVFFRYFNFSLENHVHVLDGIPFLVKYFILRTLHDLNIHEDTHQFILRYCTEKRKLLQEFYLFFSFKKSRWIVVIIAYQAYLTYVIFYYLEISPIILSNPDFVRQMRCVSSLHSIVAVLYCCVINAISPKPSQFPKTFTLLNCGYSLAKKTSSVQSRSLAILFSEWIKLLLLLLLFSWLLLTVLFDESKPSPFFFFLFSSIMGLISFLAVGTRQ